MNSDFEKNREAFLAKRREERLKFVDFWANFVSTHSDREWSSQQKILIDSQIKGARSFGWTPEAFMHMKGEKCASKKQKIQ